MQKIMGGGTNRGPIFRYESVEVPVKHPNDDGDQVVDGSGLQVEVWPVNIYLGVISIYSWLLRVNRNEMYRKKCWDTSK